MLKNGKTKQISNYFVYDENKKHLDYAIFDNKSQLTSIFVTKDPHLLENIDNEKISKINTKILRVIEKKTKVIKMTMGNQKT